MRTVHVIASGFSTESREPNIGGVETYIQLLARALAGQFDVAVHQPSQSQFEDIVGGVRVFGLGPLQLPDLVRHVERVRLKTGDVLLFSTDQYCCETDWPTRAVIQHGISWDLPTEYLTSSVLARLFEKTYRVFLSVRNSRKIKGFNHVICVDYNYFNWYQTLATREERVRRFSFIQNCAGPQFKPALSADRSGVITICFARRFVPIRGIDIFMRVARSLLDKYANLKIIFCGDGDSGVLGRLNYLGNCDSRIAIVRGDYRSMPGIYSSSDIVVIPSLASEGTSLTALEAMAMGKCVVASNVGGLTNIIIDGFNGFLVSPTAGGFMRKLADLLDEPHQITRIGRTAMMVADQCFTFEIWRSKWCALLDEISRSS